MADRCSQCLREVEEDRGFDSPSGLLCARCYFALWGPRGHRVEADENRRPASRRPPKPATRWEVPGPLGDL